MTRAAEPAGPPATRLADHSRPAESGRRDRRPLVPRVRRVVQRAFPPQVVTAAEAVEGSGGAWAVAQPAHPYVLPPVVRFGSSAIDFGKRFEPVVPELGVAHLPRATVRASSWVHDRLGRLVVELSWFGRHVDEASRRSPLPRRPRRPERLAGTALSLGSTWAGHFGHYAVEAMPRLEVFRRAGGDLDDVDHVLVPWSAEGSAARQILDRSGVPGSRIRWLDRDVDYTADVVLAPTYPGSRRQFEPLVVDFLRSLLPPGPPPTRRLMITRAGYGRNPRRLAEMEAMAASAGFEIYDPLQSSDQAADFRDAVAVIGVSGSGLTNIGYCAPGTRVLEIFSDAHTYGYYYSLAGAGGLDYGYVVGRSGDQERALGASTEDFDVDLDAFAEALAWAAAGPTAPAEDAR